MIRCVALDFDGTIADSNEIKQSAYFEAVKHLDPSGDSVRAARARFPLGDRYRVTRAIAEELLARGAKGDPLPPEDLARSLAEAYTEYCERAVSVCAEIPGARAALGELFERKLPLFVNTATPRGAVLPILRRRGLDHFFAGVYGGPASKLENLREITACAGVRPEALLFVGDGEEDRQASAHFGCPFVGIAPVGRGRRFEVKPDRCLPDLRRLARVVAEIGAGERV